MTPDAIAEALVPALEKLVAKHLIPLQARIMELEGRSVPTPEEAGAEAARLLLAGDGIKSLIDLQVTEAMEQIEPPKDGKDATEDDVRKAVAAYLKENPPEKGRDGLDLKDLFRADGGHLIAVMSDGTTKDLGQYVGKDGADYSGLEVVRSYDSATHEVVERWGEKELRYPAGGIRHGGYWREGTEVKAAETWTHAGVAWIAKRDTTQKPDRNSEDWEIFASKGRDGKDLRDAPAREPIRVGHG